MENKDVLIAQLRNLTNNMDVPAFRKTNVRWLLKNLMIRNSEHPDFNKTIELLQKLNKMGIA